MILKESEKGVMYFRSSRTGGRSCRHYNRRKHTKRVFAMVLALILCLSQAAAVSAYELPSDGAVPETASEAAPAVQEDPEETALAVREDPEEAAEAVPDDFASEAEEAASGEVVPEEPLEAAGNGGEQKSGNLKYVVSDNNAEVIITGLVSSIDGALVIPDMIDSKPVTVISDNAFVGEIGITSVSIGSYVKTIGESAFYSKRGKYLRIELAQIRKYSPSDDIVNEIIYFVYDIIAMVYSEI